MSIVHSRFHRVFFGCLNKEFGGLESKFKIHTIKSLNHHFLVITKYYM